MNRETIGSKIRHLRLRADLKQQELADRLSVTNSTISNWENDRRTPSLEELKRIANVFDTNLNFFDISGITNEIGPTTYDQTTTKTVISRQLGRIVRPYESVWSLLTLVFFFASILFGDRLGQIFAAFAVVLLIAFLIYRLLLFILIEDRHHKTFNLANERRVYLIHRDSDDVILAKGHTFKVSLYVLFVLSLITYASLPIYLGLADRLALDLISPMAAIAALMIILLVIHGYLKWTPFVRKHSYDKAQKHLRYQVLDLYLVFNLLTLLLLVTVSLFYQNQTHLLIRGLMTLFHVMTLMLSLILTNRYKAHLFGYALYAMKTDGSLEKLQ